MTEQKQAISETQGTKANINKGRRRLSKAALASPVIASLAARPAMACSVSGFISGNTSPGRGEYQCQGYGCTPGFWKEHPDLWFTLTHGLVSGGKRITISPCTKKNKNQCTYWSSTSGTKLADILSFNPFGVVSTKPLLDLLNENPGKPVFHFIGAYLNAVSSPQSYGSTAAEVIAGLNKAHTSSPNRVHEYGQLLDKLNNRGCMFDAHGRCESGFVQFIYDTNSSTCIPSCPIGTKWDPESMRCVPL